MVRVRVTMKAFGGLAHGKQENKFTNREDMTMITITTVSTTAELEICKDIRFRVFVDEQKVPAEEELDRHDETPEAAIHILARVDGVPAGTGRLIEYDPQTAKLQRLAVLKQYRGQGVGKRLVQVLEQHAKRLGYETCILDGQCHAEPFYASLGYVTISDKPFYDAGILHVRMKKSLAEPRP